jgi:hypothetical protein
MIHSLKPSIAGDKGDRYGRQKRLKEQTNPLESFSNINGFVERNQWNRSTKSMESFRKTASFFEFTCQINSKKLADFLRKDAK